MNWELDNCGCRLDFFFFFWVRIQCYCSYCEARQEVINHPCVTQFPTAAAQIEGCGELELGDSESSPSSVIFCDHLW
jgi:hypothetical protein